MTGLPLSAYNWGDQDIQRDAQLRTSLAVSCMHKAGFAGFSGDNYQGTEPPDNATALPAGAWGYLGADIAGVQGFHPPKRSQVRTAPAGTDDSEAFVTARVDCDRQIAEQLKPPSPAGTELVNRLFSESLQATGRDSRVTEATRSWADCMARSGYRVADPTTPLQQYRGPGSPTAEELATARADADCTTRSNLAGVWFAVLTGYQKQQIDQNATALAAQQKAVKDQAERIARLLAGSGTS
ncbi:hypothetical protein GCM10010193_38610 [Kitasatospora atroaurantiaca]|uniref:hypothetical protein n=1 Tax=Kitasatospora atroaurantiaca TaxID=285545 RepID=UPI0011A83087|nr:hypothetical protein [Kitasatospora atroaurantiaca]